MTDKPLNVKVPEEERDKLDEEAERMGFDSRSAYVRSMINAGRRKFDVESGGEGGEDTTLRDSVEERVVEVVAERDGVGRDEVVEAIWDDIESLVTDAMEDLNASGRIRYDMQADGFVVEGE